MLLVLSTRLKSIPRGEKCVKCDNDISYNVNVAASHCTVPLQVFHQLREKPIVSVSNNTRVIFLLSSYYLHPCTVPVGVSSPKKIYDTSCFRVGTF